MQRKKRMQAYRDINERASTNARGARLSWRMLTMGLLLGMGSFACGGTPAPTDHMAQSFAAIRAAEEAGAEEEPKAALHLKLAKEQLEEARVRIDEGEHDKAEMLLRRTDSDAELAMSIARYRRAHELAEEALGESKEIEREASEEAY